MPPLIFFGSGPVAARSLELLAADFDIEAVVTKPKPAHHRGGFPVLEVADRLGLRVHTPASKHEISELISEKPFSSPLGVVIDYGFIINQDVIDSFRLGIVNSHFSLLPEWRGADPITYSVLSGQHRTGISLMLITAGMDEGPLLAQAPYDMPADITTPALTDALIELSHRTLKEILPLYAAGDITPAPQETVTMADSTEPTYSRKLSKEDGILDWTKPAERLEREIRAYVEWPKSRTTLAGKDVVITKAAVLDTSGAPGSVTVDGKRLIVHTGEKSLLIERLKPAGKPEMSGEAFIAGHKNLI